MCIYIGIEDLVANALIEVIENSDRHEVRFRDLNDYGARVIQILNREEDRAVLIMSRERTSDFLHDYTQYFELVDIEGEEGIALKEDISVDILWEAFRGCIATEVMLAFMNKNSIEALGVCTA